MTAVPTGGGSFREWTRYDPNHPWDENYAVKDANNPITVVMDADRQVEAAFKCGSGAGPFLIPAALGLIALRATRRR